MASTTTPRRSEAGLSLRATVTQGGQRSDRTELPAAPPISWPAIAVVGGLVTAMASWILTAGIAVVGWLVADPGTLAQSLDVGTRLWLLGNGVSASLAGTAVTVVPWGATALIAFMLSRFAAVAARQVRADQTAGPAAITVVLVATYLVPVVAVAVWRGEPWHAPEHWAAVIAVLAGAAALGSSRALGGSLTDGWPVWARAMPRAVVDRPAGAVRRRRCRAGDGPDRASGSGERSARPARARDRRRHRAAAGPVCRRAECHRLGRRVRPRRRVPRSAAARSSRRPQPSSASCPACRCSAHCPRPDRVRRPSSAGSEPAYWPGRSPRGSPSGRAPPPGWTAPVWSAVSLGSCPGSSSSAWPGPPAGTSAPCGWPGLGPRLLPLLVMAVTTLGLAGMITGLVAGLLPRRTRPH